MNINTMATLIVAGLTFATYAAETNYHSPIDGKSYKADWRTYTPTNPPATNAVASRVQKKEIRLLSTQEEFGRNIDVEDLTGFIRKTESSIEKSLGPTNASFELLVQTQLTKDKKPHFDIASKGNVPEGLLQKIYDGFAALPDYRSRKDDLRYEVRFAITKKP